MKTILGTAVLFTLAIGQSFASDGSHLQSLPCPDVTIDYNSHQRWQPGSSPYGLPFEAWTPESFRALKERAVECSNSDAQSFVAYIGYLEGITMNTLAAQEDERRRKAAAEEERDRALVDAERLRQKNEAAAEEFRKRMLLEAKRARQEKEAAEAAGQSQAQLEARALEEQEIEPEEATTEPQPANPMFPLDVDVKIFVKNNPQLAKDLRPLTADDLMLAEALFRNQAVVELSLMLCNERWNDFPGQQEEVSRRIDLLRRVYFQYFGLPLEKYGEFRESANQIFASTQATDYLLADLNGLYELCQQSLLEVSYGFNFATE